MLVSLTNRAGATATAVLAASTLLVGGAPATAQASPVVQRTPVMVAESPNTAAAQEGPATPLPAAVPAAGLPRSVTGMRCAKIKYATYGRKRLPVAGFCGRKMSRVEMVWVLRRAGFSWNGMQNSLATYMAESDGYVLAFHINRARDGKVLSTDVGWTQINDRYHAIRSVNYTDPVVAARFARSLVQRYSLRIWVGYHHRGPHLKKAAAAIRAARAAGVR